MAKFRVFGAVMGVLGAFAAVDGARADYMVQNDTSFSYIGTVTDPTGTVNTIPSFSFNNVTYTGRDASIYAASNAPTSIAGAGYENATEFLTAWYPTLTPANGYGWGNPNNSDTGFVQLYDQTNGTPTSATGQWDQSLTNFTLHVTGVNATSASTYARLWDAPLLGGAAGDTGGEFLTYDRTLTAHFAAPATQTIPGWYATAVAPDNVSGSVTGSFQNQSTTNTAANGLYQFNLTFQNQNWASDNNASFTGASYFGSNNVPEPASMALLGLGLAGLGVVRRQRNG